MYPAAAGVSGVREVGVFFVHISVGQTLSLRVLACALCTYDISSSFLSFQVLRSSLCARGYHRWHWTSGWLALDSRLAGTGLLVGWRWTPGGLALDSRLDSWIRPLPPFAGVPFLSP